MKNKPRENHLILLQNAHLQVIRLEGMLNYTKFILNDGSSQLMSYTLKSYSNSLDFPFLRVSKSCIINLRFYSNFCFEQKRILLTDGTEIQVSRRKFREFLENMPTIND